jgi:tRNA U55 pseudouridine synthase TruB
MNKLAALNGVFAVNKPIGWTSRDVVNRVQNVLTASWYSEQSLPVPRKKVKMGHGGTLVRNFSCQGAIHLVFIRI